MPGGLTMDGDGYNGSDSKIAERGYGSGIKDISSVHGKDLAFGDQLSPQLDGPVEAHNGVSVGEVFANGGLSSSAANVTSSATIEQSLTRSQVELPHITDGYQPLGKLAERLAQQCFTGIADLVNELGDVQDAQQASQSGVPTVNGTNQVNGTGNSVSASTQKRERIIEWANNHREGFIKLLVLSQWCRQVEDVGKLIDLNAWAREQKYLYEQLAWDLGMLKRDLHGAKIPNPDIRTSLEVLSTGKAPWMPDLGYLPPEPLTAQNMLKTLRNINALLSIRLNLHEDIPHYFRKFIIANGRVTFVVPFEFELDLSIADEDPTSQFFFIDFRLLFSPTSEIPTGQLHAFLEERANSFLSTEGLKGCHDFLHNFVLTHKINVFRKQAMEMSGKAWSQTIRVEPVHRCLVVQYWLERPGSKSWVEIGIASGKQKDGKAAIEDGALPHIAIKWIRAGKEVPNVNLHFDTSDLSMDTILSTIVKLHTRHILDSVRAKLSQMPLYAGTLRLLTLQTGRDDSEIDETPAVLRFQGIGDDDPVYTLLLEPHTGHLTVQPAEYSSKVDNEINRLRDPAVDAHLRLQTFLFGARQAKIEQIAELSGWRRMRILTSRIKWETIKASFGQDVARCSFFTRERWSGSDWTVAVSICPTGETWWIVQIFPAETGTGIRIARPIPAYGKSRSLPSVSQSFLVKVEQLAVVMISFLVASQELQELNIPHVCRQSTPSMLYSSAGSNARFALPALFIKFSALMKLQKAHKAWSNDWLRLSHHGFASVVKADGKHQLTQLLTGFMKAPLNLRNVLLQSQQGDADFSFLPNGAFALVLRLTLGTHMIKRLVARLKDVQRLQMILKTLKRKNIEAESASLCNISFSYAERYKVELVFTDADPTILSFFPASNPHHRMRHHLADLVNEGTDDTGFSFFVEALMITVPLMEAFDLLESKAPQETRVPAMSPSAATSPSPPRPFHVTIHSRSWRFHRLRYPTCNFDFELLRRRGSEPEWCVTASPAIRVAQAAQGPVAVSSPLQLLQGLRDLVREKGNGWKGLRGSRPSWAASIDDVKELIGRIDDVVRSSSALCSAGDVAAEVKKPPDDEAEVG